MFANSPTLVQSIVSCSGDAKMCRICTVSQDPRLILNRAKPKKREEEDQNYKPVREPPVYN
jgi:hypothetical protein